MLKEIIKRDGSIVEFDPNKINLAIKKAFVAARGESDEELIGKLTKAVVRYLKANVPEDTTKTTIEDVQDAVEHVLIKYNLPKVAKEYILYRDLHNKIRTNKNILLDSYKLVGEYVDKVDWRVNENANAGYSYASMLNHISGSVVANYTLANMYPERIAKAHIDGDFHIHDLSAGIIPYCMGHSLKDLLMMGFIGVSGRASSKPAKHLDAALQQISNFMATLQTEAAGAQAFSSWDTYLAPFVHYDKLNYNQVKQMVQQFIFGLNIASRWGQCCKAQCKILSKHKGWVNYENLEIGDEIYVFDPKMEALKFDTVTHITVEPFKGHLHKYTNDQIEFSGSVTPKHRMVYRTGINGWRIKESKDIIPAKRIKIPVSATLYDADIEEIFKDEFLQLLVCVLTEGCIQQPPNKAPMIDIYKSPTRWGGDFIKELLTKLGIEFSIREEVNKEWNSVCERIHLKDCPEVWDVLHHLNYTKKAIPAFLTELNVRQSELIIKLWAKLDGYVITDNKETGSYKCRIQCDNDTIRGSLAEIAIRAGMSCRWVDSYISHNKTSTKHLVIYNAVEREVTGDEDTEEYDGIVWCPTTNTGTIIVKDCDSGHVFITGNSPFTNITLDLVPPHDLKDMPVIIGGELQDTTYGEYQKEMDMLNMAFIETMLEGDAEGKVFTFPIPTYNIVKDFNWDSEISHKLFELTCKYGSPYFANFLNSDMDVSDSRSMCCRLRLNIKELRRKNGGLFGSGEKTGCYDDQTEVLTNNGWKLFKDVLPDDEICTLSSESEIEYHKPIQSFIYDYDGELIHFKSLKSDLMVTPNHRMLYADKHNHKHGFVNAEDYSITKHPIPNKGTWRGGKYSASIFELPAIKSEWKSGNYGSNQIKKWDAIAIDMITWVKFLGLWLSKGSVDNINIAPTHGYRVIISQTKEHNLKYIEEILDSMPFKWVYDGNNFIICNKQLWTYMKQFGKQKDRYVPTYVKDLGADYIAAFLNALWLGDGSVHKTSGQSVYYTTSKQLADDVQELLVKAGYQASMHQRKPRICKIGDRTVNSSMICYEVSVRFSAYTYLNDKISKRVPYRGKVYCLEVPNNTMMVRRNGYTLWCGNSVGVVTINMPRLGYLSKTKEEFFSKLEYLMILAKDSLEIKRKIAQRNIDNGLLPYTKIYITSLKNHFSTIGLVGMNEACLNLLGVDITTPEGNAFAVETMKFMRAKLSEFQEESDSLFNLEGSPAEACLDKDTPIQTVYGSKTISQIIQYCEKNNKDSIPVFSYNTELKKIEVKPAFAFLSKRDANVMKITFDDGFTVICTHYHPFGKRILQKDHTVDVEWVEAKDLKVGDRIKSNYIGRKMQANGDYYYLTSGRQPVHKLVAEYIIGRPLAENEVVHHKDGNKLNNSPDNIVVLTYKEHKSLRIRLNQELYPEKFRAQKGSKNPFYGKHHSDETKERIRLRKIGRNMGDENSSRRPEVREKLRVIAKNKPAYKHSHYNHSVNNDLIIGLYKEGKNVSEISKETGYTYSTVRSRLHLAGILERNHVITKIEYLNEKIDVYNLEVEDNHNFFIGYNNGILTHNTSYRLAKIDKKKFSDIITAGTDENPYYTNSTQIPVGYTDDIFEACDLQNEVQSLYTGGTVEHLYLGERLEDPAQAAKLIKTLCTNYKIPYFSITPTFSICKVHGYIPGNHSECPYDKGPIERPAK